MSKSLYPYILAIVLGACDQAPDEEGQGFQDSKASFTAGEGLSLLEQESSNPIQDSLVAKSLKGFQVSEHVTTDLTEVTTADLEALYKSETRVFTYEAPNGFKAEFSRPVVFSSSFMALGSEDPTRICRNQTYHSSEMSFKELSERSLQANSCGRLQLRFCIRLSQKQTFEDSVDYSYKKSPLVVIDMPCGEESFTSASVSFASDSEGEGMIRVEAPPFVNRVYLTANASCSKGGAWQRISKKLIPWNVQASLDDGQDRVFAKFRNIFNEESGCLSILRGQTEKKTPILQVKEPKNPDFSVKIAAKTLSRDGHADLLIEAKGSEEMYLTNVEKCVEGGVWEVFSKTKPKWKFLAGQGNKSVYAKFRNSQGIVSPCIEGQMLERVEPPVAVSLEIAEETVTRNMHVDLVIEAEGASEMYITNSAQCLHSGTWEVYDIKKKDWELSEENRLNSVYVKFRNIDLIQSECLQTSIIHDDLPPVAPKIMIGSGAFTSLSSPTIYLSAIDADMTFLSHDSLCHIGAWEYFEPRRMLWELGQNNSVSLVYAKFRDLAGNETDCVNDSIIHDNLSPSAPLNLDDGTLAENSSTSPLITWEPSVDLLAGISHYEIGIGTSAGINDIKPWTIVGDVLSARFDDLSMNIGQTYYANVRAIDNAANVSLVSSGDGFSYGLVQQAYLKSGSNDSNDYFGRSVAISQDTLVVGLDGDDSSARTITNGAISSIDNLSDSSGAVFVYRRNGNSWTQEAHIKVGDNDRFDYFGYVVAISGDTIVVGAPGEDSDPKSIVSNAQSSPNNDKEALGAAYVFQRSGSTWTQVAFLKPPHGEPEQDFGRSVAIFDDTIVVGSPGESSSQTFVINGSGESNDESSSRQGAAYVYRKSGGVWIQEAYLKGANGDAGDTFGGSVAIFGDTIAVSAAGESSSQNSVTNGQTASPDNSSPRSGAVYIFKRAGEAWAEEAYLKASQSDFGDRFGTSVSLFADTIVVGAKGESSAEKSLIFNGQASLDNSLANAGAAYVFTRDGEIWSEQAYLKASNADANDEFGFSVSISDDLIAVGAPFENSMQNSITLGQASSTDNSKSRSGAVYLFNREDGQWTQTAYIKASNSEENDTFGESLAVFGGSIAVGARLEDSELTEILNNGSASDDNSSSNSGAVYIFNQ